jgi:hypothetical protein
MRLFLIILTVVFTVPAMIVGLSWLIFVSLPYIVLLAIGMLFVRRSQQQNWRIAEATRCNAERERELNRQEFEAWRSANEASRRQMASPIPLPPPVTIAVRPSNPRMYCSPRWFISMSTQLAPHAAE